MIEVVEPEEDEEEEEMYGKKKTNKAQQQKAISKLTLIMQMGLAVARKKSNKSVGQLRCTSIEMFEAENSLRCWVNITSG